MISSVIAAGRLVLEVVQHQLVSNVSIAQHHKLVNAKKISALFVIQSWETVPNRTSGKIKLIPPACI